MCCFLISSIGEKEGISFPSFLGIPASSRRRFISFEFSDQLGGTESRPEFGLRFNEDLPVSRFWSVCRSALHYALKDLEAD